MGLGLALMYKFIDKEGLMDVIRLSLPPKEAGLLAGMMVGDKSGLETSFYRELQETGLVHIVVASGANVMLLTRGLVESLAGILGRKRIIIIALIMAWWYTSMVGWEMPIVRAVLMVSIFYWSQILGRKYDLVRALILTVGVMVTGGGVDVLTSVSFWLSITAFIGVVSYKGPKLGETVWVNLWITPILALVFGKISLVTPVTNMLVLFLVETVTVIGGIGTVMGTIFLLAGRVVLMLIYPLLRYCVWVVEVFSKWRWAEMEISFNWWMMVGWYVILGWFLIRKRNYR